MDAYRFSISWSRILPSKYKQKYSSMFFFSVNKLQTKSKDDDYNEDVASDYQSCWIVRVLISKYVTAFRGDNRWRY